MELKQYLMVFVRWAWLLALGVLLAGLTAYVASKLTPPTYRAETTLMVRGSSTSSSNEYNSLMANSSLARTYVEMLQSPAVLREVATELGGPIYPDTYVDGTVAVETVHDTLLIRITVESQDPAAVVAIAELIPKVFSEQNSALQSGRYNSSKDALQAQMATVQRDIDSTQQQLASLSANNAGAQRATLETNLAQYRSTYASLLNSYEQIRVAEVQQTDSLVVTDAPQLPTEPVGPRTLLNTLLAVIVAAVLAYAVALLLERLDDRIIRTEQLEPLKLPTLASIPVIEGTSVAARLIVARAPNSVASEAYRLLRTNLEYAAVGKRALRRVMITSAEPGEGKSTTAANLAASLAQTGKRVTLIDCDLRRPTQHEIFGLMNSVGLTTAMVNVGTRGIALFMQRTHVPNLLVMTSGPVPPNPAEMLDSSEMARVLDELAATADILVIDTPPVVSVADAAIVARVVDGVLLVLQLSSTHQKSLLRARDMLDAVGTRNLGLLVNRARMRTSAYYYGDGAEQARRPGLLANLRRALQ